MNPDDEDLDRLLAETAALRKRMRAEDAGDQPPARLDDAILAASRRAVSARPVPLGGSGFRRWRTPLAAAAVVVLATSVALLMLQEGEHERVLESAPPALAPPEGAVERRQSESKDMSPPQTAPVLRQERAETPRAAEARRDTRSLEIMERERDVGPARGRPMERIEPSAPAAPPAPGAPAADAATAEKPALEPAAGQTSASAATAESAAEAAKAESVPAPAPIRSVERERTNVQANAVAKRQAAAPDDALAGKLESIRKQWEGGDQAGARAALEVFLREHPGYVLPADFPVPRPAPPVPQEAPVQGR